MLKSTPFSFAILWSCLVVPTGCGQPSTPPMKAAPNTAAASRSARGSIEESELTRESTADEIKALIRELAKQADVFVENYKVGDMARYGLDPASLHALNPQLVYCSITGFGQTGPYAPRAGYDFLAQGMGGIMSLNGDPSTPPQKVAVAVTDIICGIYSTVGILAALQHRHLTGRGQQVEVALYDIAMTMCTFYGMAYLISGENPGRFGNSPNGSPTVGVYEASDGPLYMACANDRLVRRLLGEVLLITLALNLLGLAARLEGTPSRAALAPAMLADIDEAVQAIRRQGLKLGGHRKKKLLSRSPSMRGPHRRDSGARCMDGRGFIVVRRVADGAVLRRTRWG